MSVSTLAHPPRHRAALTKFWFGVAVVVAIAIGLAWFGAASLRGQTTASGLNIRTIEPGNGPFVKAVDGVLIDYEGRLPNGTVFDSSAGRGPQPLIAGGSNPPPGSPIPPNSDLDFDVHVDQVVPNAAMMAAQQQGAQGGQSSEGQPIEGQPGAGESAIPQGQ